MSEVQDETVSEHAREVVIGLALRLKGESMGEENELCENCGNLVSKELCHCGEYLEGHGWYNQHYGIPMGCTCGYAEEANHGK